MTDNFWDICELCLGLAFGPAPFNPDTGELYGHSERRRIWRYPFDNTDVGHPYFTTSGEDPVIGCVDHQTDEERTAGGFYPVKDDPVSRELTRHSTLLDILKRQVSKEMKQRRIERQNRLYDWIQAQSAISALLVFKKKLDKIYERSLLHCKKKKNYMDIYLARHQVNKLQALAGRRIYLLSTRKEK
jgi:hypothetical protein